MPVVPRAASVCPRSDLRPDSSAPPPVALAHLAAPFSAPLLAEHPMIGRLQQAGDFRRLLESPARQRSAHFAVHYVCARPAVASPAQAKRDSRCEPAKLSTGHEPNCPETVDDCPDRRWLGCLVPKRHARRAVTRSLLKRQMRAVVHAHEAGLSAGLWLIRLSRPFSPQIGRAHV